MSVDIAKMMSMIGGKKKPVVEVDEEEPESEDEGDLGEEGMHAAMSDFIAAVKSGDVEAALEAFGNLKEHE